MKRVQYGIKLNKENQSLPSDYVGLITDVDFKLTQVKFDLSFSDKISKFSLNDNSLSDEDNFVILDIINMKFGKEIYSKVNCDTVFSKVERFEEFKNKISYTIIKSDWFITLDRKKINGFECSKALGTLIVNYGDGGKIKYDGYVAWFCYDIKSSFGPVNFSGLPGLILELELPLAILSAQNISHLPIINDITILSEKIMSEDSLFSSLRQ